MLVASEITTLGRTVLLVVAVTFIVWSLITALVVPRKNPGFPRNMRGFIVASAILFVAQMSAVVWVTGTQEIEHAEAATGEHGGEAGGGETGGGGEVAAGDAAAGKEVFESAGCASCHTLADAGATGSVGPNLDEAQPPADLVFERVTNGQGVMPSFGDQLSEQQRRDVAAYVSSVAGSGS